MIPQGDTGTMMRLYKFRAKSDGIRGRFKCVNGESQWLNKHDADLAIACGTTIAVRCTGEAAPYFAIMEFDPVGRNMIAAENLSIGKWFPPRGHRIIPSNEYLAKYGNPNLLRRSRTEEAPQENHEPRVSVTRKGKASDSLNASKSNQ